MAENKLFDLDEAGTGSVTHIRGVEVGAGDSSQIIRVFAEHSKIAPPKETNWALRGAYGFAKSLQSPSREDDLDR